MPPPDPGTPPSERVDILLVDDRPENLLTLEAMLEDLGQHLVRAGSGREALRAVLEREYAVILMDVMMPEMDGFETATLIRQRETSQRTPIIFVSAVDRNPSHNLQAYGAGAVDFIYKPVDPFVLRAKVSVFIDLHQKSKQLRRFNETLETRVRARTRELREAHEQLQHEVEERRRAEAEVRELNRKLERRVNQRTAALEAVNRELKAFSYSISHDLRAPLRRIDSFCTFLEDEYADTLDERGQDYLHRIRRSCTAMQSLIDDMLKLSRVSQHEMEQHEVDLSELVHEIAEELLQADDERNVDFIIEDDVRVQGDPRLLQLALHNLLENAFKFTGQTPDAQIEFGKTSTNGQASTFFVRDNGVGFDMAHVEKLFQPFSRLHGTAIFPGTGLGLSIVARVMRRHHGRIWAESEAGTGATFYFTLPNSHAEMTNN